MAEEESVPMAVPVLLSVLAGYVDSCTFLALFGLFVAQVTGSFVLTGTQLVAHESGGLMKTLAIPVFFAACIVTTVLMRRRGAKPRSALAAALTLETGLLIGLFVALCAGEPLRGPDTPAAICAAVFGLCAMGVQGALVRLVARGFPSTNVMTTNTVQLAIDATELAMAWRAHRRAPADADAAAAYARVKQRTNHLWPIVLGFLVGTITGALAFARFQVWCILAAIALAAALALWTGHCARSEASA
jgi:uncharacterized membrane protein YoaK (UPF0700 family)